MMDTTAPKGYLAFWRQCIRMAVRGSSEFANDWGWLVGVPALAGILVFLGKPGLFQDGVVGSVIAAAIVFVITFLVRFLAKLTTAPVTLYEESEQALRVARAELESRRARKQVIDELARLRQVGVKLRNEQLTPEGYGGWAKRLLDWRTEVLVAADNASPALKYRLEVLDQMKDPPSMPVLHPSHGKQVQIASEILLRIDEFLKKEQ